MTALFFWPAPLALKQGYLVVVGTVTAYVFTFVPEWTTWALLVAMALYDLWAVLSPGGPLKARLSLGLGLGLFHLGVDHLGAAGGHGAVRPVGRAVPGRPAHGAPQI